MGASLMPQTRQKPLAPPQKGGNREMADFGPSIRRKRGDVELVDRPDPHNPNITVRGAQKVPGYDRLWRQGTLTADQRHAADRYGRLVERAGGAAWRPDGAQVRVDCRAYGPTAAQVDAEHELRHARAALGRAATEVADLVAVGGVTVAELASHLAVSEGIARGMIVAALQRLVEHWRLDA